MTKARDIADGTFSGDLTVDTDTLHVDSTNNRVGVGTSSPQRSLHISGTDQAPLRVSSTNTTAAGIEFLNNGTTVAPSVKAVGTVGNNLQFNTNNSEAMRITSDGSVGIGNTAPTHNLHVTDTGTPNVVIESSAGSSSDAKLRIRGSRTTSVQGDLAQILFETNDDDAAGDTLAFITAGKDVASTNKGVIRFGTTTTDGGTPSEHMRVNSSGQLKFIYSGTDRGTIGTADLGTSGRNLFVGHGDTGLSFQGHTDNAITPMSASGLANRSTEISLGAVGSMFKDVYANNFKTTGTVMRISVDDDGSGSNQAIYFQEGGVTRMSMEDNDVYVSDNILAGYRYEAGGTNRAFDTTSSHISAYAANNSDPSASGFANYRTFIQAYNTTDPDVAVFQAFSKDVMADTGVSNHSEKSTAHMLDNAGRGWHWNSQHAGRVRVGSTGTTTAYRASDNSFTAYSGTGNAQGHTTYAGFTQINGRESANGDDVFLVHAGGQHRIEFDASGNGRFDGGADISAADYAEYFEWQDGNPNNEDRRGHSVVLNSDGTIRIATASDPVDDIIGIVSVEAAVVGDSAWAAWTGKYERDRFGQTVYEDYDLLCWGQYNEDSKSYKTQTTRQAMIDAGREDDIPEDAITVTKRRKKLAADYDPDREYIPRKDRQEWVAIGLMGKLPLLDGQPTGPRWRKLFDLNDEVEMWLVR